MRLPGDRPSGAGDKHITYGTEMTGPMIREEQGSREETGPDSAWAESGGLNGSSCKGKNEAQEGRCRGRNKLVPPGKFCRPVGKSLQSSLKYLQGIGSNPVGGSTESFEMGAGDRIVAFFKRSF